MYGPLWFLVWNLPSGATALPYGRIYETLETITEVVAEEAPIDFPDLDDEYEERVRTALITATFAWCEGGWKTDPGGQACGTGQMFPLAGEPSCWTLRHDFRTAIRAMVRRLRGDVAFCGSVRGGLGRYATGHCGWAQELVEHRCRWSGEACGPR